MSRPKTLRLSRTPATVLVAVVALFASPASQAGFWIPLPPAAPKHPPAHSKRRAERNVLAFVPRGWNREARRVGLINPATNLLNDNVQAVCRGKGRRIGTRYRRYRCVVRRWPRRSAAGLYLSYRARAGNGFRVHLVRVRRQ